VEFQFPLSDPKALQGVDWVVCDSIAARAVKHPRVVPYRLISVESLAELASTISSYQREKEVSLKKKGQIRRRVSKSSALTRRVFRG
jgi:hypothetical protein